MFSFKQLGHCQGSVWQFDDISECVQHDYLKVILPLSAVVVSLLLLLSLVVSQKIHPKHPKYPKISQNTYFYRNNHTSDVVENQSSAQAIIDGEDLQPLAIGNSRLLITKNGSIIELAIPRGQFKILLLETLVVLTMNALNITALVSHIGEQENKVEVKTTAIAGIITWTYISILVLSRLVLFKTNQNSFNLWNHTMVIYITMWLLSLTIFRSILIHPRQGIIQFINITDFILKSLLFLIAITTRRGNKIVLMENENNIEPSREPLASLLSLASFTWVDKIVWKGFQKTLEISEVWNLVSRDKAAAVLADFRQLKKTTALSMHLLRYFKGTLFVQCIFAIISALFSFMPTLILKSILEYIEDPTIAPRNVIWLYVFLLAFTDIIRSIAGNQALWIGRKISINLRAIIIGELYTKALRRKAASGADTILGNSKAKKNQERPSLIKKISSFGKKKVNQADSDCLIKDTIDVTTKPKDEQVNVGTIINLMSVDSFNVSEITAYLHFLFAAAPVQLIIAVYLLYQILGYSSIPGLVVMIILLPVNITLARGIGNSQKKIMAATDERIHITNEVLQNIRIIKYFAWEKRFGKLVNEKRRKELDCLKTKFILWASAVAIWNTVPITITFFSFLVYTLWEGKSLYPSIAFTAISLFNILRVPLDQLGDMIAHVLESKVSIDRIEEFLNEEETDKYNQLRNENIDDGGNKLIGFKKATFSWGTNEVAGSEIANNFCLIDLDIRFEIGKLNIIAGPTGSGKTSLIMALLGEMTLVKGKVFSPGGRSRENIRQDPETGLTESVAYCAQQAWLVNANIKDNILFAAPYDKKRYSEVIFACALERDLQVLDAGDETLVGEKGITLSGGQKQRISLARALYSNSKHVFLDDCLSAVDSHTAKWVFEKCICGPLMSGRTCILVTHNLALCVPQSEYVVLLQNGKIDIQGKPSEVIAPGKLGQEISKTTSESTEHHEQSSNVTPSLDDENREILVDENDATKNIQQVYPKKNAMTETRAEGGVKLSIIFLYLRSMGSWWFWAISVVIFGVQQFGSLAANAWIRQWANQYNSKSLYTNSFLDSKVYYGSTTLTFQTASSNFGLSMPRISHYFDSKELSFKSKDTQDVNVSYYLAIYAAIGLSCMVVTLFRDLWLFFGSLTASWQIHKRLLLSVIRAKLKFFDATPLGQLMNRFSKDLEAVDQEVAPVSIGMISCALAILVTISLITIITPGFLIAAVVISCMYILVGIFYLRSSRDLKRLESVQRSPLFQHFGETLSGITTIRAFGDEKRFIRDNLLRINNHNRPFIYLWATNRWLAFRMELIGNIVAFVASAFIVLSIGKIDAGSAGLSLSYAISFTENVLWFVRLYAMNEQNMNSVERLKEYLDVEQEAEAVIEETKPSADWPRHGSVEFINYSTRYRKDLDPVLKNLSFKISPGEKVGVVGRTGAGKSSLALALFRGLEAEEGKILIDGVDIGLIGLQDLREAITIVPQDPTLFSGTIRTNLDPFSIFSDKDIFTALRRVQLIGSDTSTRNTSLISTPNEQPTSSDLIENYGAETSSNFSISATITNKNIFLNLSSPVSESGSNLSQGQRQLLCLARALLKNPKVLMMDEATASIDYSTDSKIQDTIRELNSTIITIAHRLQTIVDYDKVLVLDHGRVVEFGHPWNLLKDETLANDSSSRTKNGTIKTGLFRSMCEMSGDFDLLMKTAKNKWDAGRLVDDD